MNHETNPTHATSKPNDIKAKKFLSGAAVAAVCIGFMWLSAIRADLTLNFLSLLQFRQRLIQGFLMTIVIAVFSLLLSLIIGSLAAVGQRSKITLLSYLSNTYVQIIRGTPLLVQIYFFFYIIGTAWGITNRYVAGILILSIFEGAYVSEIIRGGLASIESRQYEIAAVNGFTRRQTLRLVTLPILLLRILPALAGQFASIIKDSSLLSVVAIIEITQTTQEISATNYAFIENYLFLGLLYFALTFPLSMLAKWIERKLSYEH